MNYGAQVWQGGCGLFNKDVMPNKKDDLGVMMLVEEQIRTTCVIVDLKSIFWAFLVRNLDDMFNIQAADVFENSLKDLNPCVSFLFLGLD